MEEAEKAAAESEAERCRTLHFEGEARIVEAQLAHCRAQVLEIGGIDRKETAEDDLLRRLEAGERRGAGPFLIGDRIADARIGNFLDLRGDEADLARPQFFDL